MACPYKPEAKLNLQKHNKSKTKVETIEVEVDELYTELSTCSMKVKLLETKGGPEYAVLKLYDRRFSPEVRDEGTVLCEQWSPELEEEYIDFIRDGKAEQFVKHLDDLDDDSDEHKDWDSVQCEAYAQDLCRQQREDEAFVYQKLGEHQGKHILNFHGFVTLLHPSPLPNDSKDFSEGQKELLQVCGILIEYVSGPTLGEMPEPEYGIPKESWKGYVMQATELLEMLHGNNMVLKRMSGDNF